MSTVTPTKANFGYKNIHKADSHNYLTPEEYKKLMMTRHLKTCQQQRQTRREEAARNKLMAEKYPARVFKTVQIEDIAPVIAVYTTRSKHAYEMHCGSYANNHAPLEPEGRAIYKITHVSYRPLVSIKHRHAYLDRPCGYEVTPVRTRRALGYGIYDGQLVGRMKIQVEDGIFGLPSFTYFEIDIPIQSDPKSMEKSIIETIESIIAGGGTFDKTWNPPTGERWSVEMRSPISP